MRLGLVCVLVLLAGIGDGGGRQPESFYRNAWCRAHHGEAEVELPAGRVGSAGNVPRCDCLTATHAVEVDRARFWQAALGQALYYAALTNRDPGLVLVVETDTDRERLRQLQSVIDRYHLPVQVWNINAER